MNTFSSPYRTERSVICGRSCMREPESRASPIGNRLDVCLNGFALSGTIATADVEGHGATALSVRCGSQRVHAVRLDSGPKTDRQEAEVDRCRMSEPTAMQACPPASGL